MIIRYFLMCFECVIKCSYYNMVFIWNRKLIIEEVEVIGIVFVVEINRRDEDIEMFVFIYIVDSYLIVIENWCKKNYERLFFFLIIC